MQWNNIECRNIEQCWLKTNTFFQKASKKGMLCKMLPPVCCWCFTCERILNEKIFFPLPKVRYLKIIEKSGYQALPWVRYITQNGGRSWGSATRCPDVQLCIRQQLGNHVQHGGNGACTDAVPWKLDTWGNVATSCQMWESELFFKKREPSPTNAPRLSRLHMSVFFSR